MYLILTPMYDGTGKTVQLFNILGSVT